MATYTEYRRAWQARRAAGENLCSEPGCKTPPAPYRAKCQHHLELRRKHQPSDTENKRILRAWNQEAKRKAGICLKCNGKAMAGYDLCGYHQELAEDLLEEGRTCSNCKKPRERGHTKCRECLDRNKLYMRQVRARCKKHD